MILKAIETLADSVLSVNSSLPNYPVTNVLDSRLSRIFKTDGELTAEIVFDAGSAVTVSGIAIANHNISFSFSTVKLQANATDVWTAPSFELDLTCESSLISCDFPEETYRYWRLQVIDSTNANGYIQLGRVWIGQSYVTPGISTTLTHDRTSASVKSSSTSGQTYQDKRFLYSSINTTFPAVTHTEKAEIFNILDTIDIGEPFFVTFDETCSDIGTLYVTMDLSSLRATLLNNRDYYTIGISFIEEK
jgi:hypothetical protein